MAKGKDVRIPVLLECTACVRNGVNKESKGISRYITQKNRHNTPNRLELLKFCPYCNKHTIHGEMAKRRPGPKLFKNSVVEFLDPLP